MFSVPSSVRIFTASPSCDFKRALPTGESQLIVPLLKSASSMPTSLTVISVLSARA